MSANQTLKELKIQVRLPLLPGTRKKTQSEECGGSGKGLTPQGDGDGRWGRRCHSSRGEVSVCPQIMHAFSVAPFDQNLSLDGKILSDDTATLGSLGVIPESVILLKVPVRCDSGMPRDW